jgi:RHS repeat-associated protein
VALAAGSTPTIQTYYGYDPYGATQTTGSASANSFLFTGRENDQTGLYSYRARYYNPTWGQFVSEDPIALRGGINVYQAGCGESGEPSPESIQTFQWRSKSLILMSLMRKNSSRNFIAFDGEFYGIVEFSNDSSASYNHINCKQFR